MLLRFQSRRGEVVGVYYTRNKEARKNTERSGGVKV